jgi:hypothetical protein
VTRARLFAVLGLGAVLATMALPVGAGGAGAETVLSVPASIDATGTQDVTQALNTLIGSAPDGATVRFPAGGRFRIDGVVFVSGRHDVTIDGRGSTLVAPTDGATTPVPRYNFRAAWPRLRQHVDIENSTGITVRDLTVVGPNPTGEFKARFEGQAGFAIARSNDVTLDHVAVRATYGDGVYIVGHSTGVHVQDCTLDHNGRQGVAVTDGVDITVERCAIVSAGRSAIDLEPARGAARNVHVQDNEVRDATNFLLAAGGAGVNVGDVWLERNHVTGGRGVSVFAGQARFLRSGIHVIDNTGEGGSKGFQNALLRFERFDGVEVKGNKQAVGKGVSPIVLLNSCHADVSGNDFGGAPTTPVVTGDCAAPGLAPATSSTSGAFGAGGARRPAAAPEGRDPRANRRVASTTTSTTVPPPVVERGGGTSPVTVVLAFVLGGLAGAGGLALVQRNRNRGAVMAPSRDRAAAAQPAAPDGDADSGADTDTDSDADG